jgi:hypothetical protein
LIDTDPIVIHGKRDQIHTCPIDLLPTDIETRGLDGDGVDAEFGESPEAKE